ncbi:S-adenosyl-L-methionine-dependent methyltransferase [Polyplosphaeria fusca]|uniref:S-adenosyl-L-methionine-dependent methyltransferase n=1 Tax=Polyplosphaeria fusca TaxID=682080 RepID=A0A9P4V0J3_9PLEO|nr:S-adenosyl-L-methionine-dependent methyltransferase [Polyplosphaeria fusca]
MSQPQPTKTSEEVEKAYIFGRDFRSSMRLNFNHYLMREMAGYLTHPDIPLAAPQLRIADVGTGTGIWACELATKLSSTAARIDAFDISDLQFPAPAFHPASVHFHVHNSFQPYADAFHGQFDVVHVRFMMCSVNDANARKLLGQLLTLMKPGGWLQWYEPLPRATKVVAPPENSIVPAPAPAPAPAPVAGATASERLAKTWRDLDPLGSYSWVENLHEMCTQGGLQAVSRDVHYMPEHLRPLWAQSSLAATADVLPQANMWSEQDGGITAQYIQDLQAEITSGVAVDTPFQCIVGRKAEGG